MTRKHLKIIGYSAAGLFVILYAAMDNSRHKRPSTITFHDVASHCQSVYDPADLSSQAECRYSYMEQMFVAKHFGRDPQQIAVFGFDSLNKRVGLANGMQDERIERLEGLGKHSEALDLETDILIGAYNAEPDHD